MSDEMRELIEVVKPFIYTSKTLDEARALDPA